MKSLLYKAESRGHFDYGWLEANHSFSFAGFYDPERMGFGDLRVLNDDIIQPDTGFGTHPHNNMEIITIPIFGSLEHKDSMGSKSIIGENEIQVMTAGSGITHSEYNPSKTQEAHIIQIWIHPESESLEPRYDQKKFDVEDRVNKIQTMVNPQSEGGLYVNQNAWISRSMLENGKDLKYNFHSKSSGLYVFLISGKIEIDGIEVNPRDGIGIWDSDSASIISKEISELLFLEVPMQ